MEAFLCNDNDVAVEYRKFRSEKRNVKRTCCTLSQSYYYRCWLRVHVLNCSIDRWQMNNFDSNILFLIYVSCFYYDWSIPEGYSSDGIFLFEFLPLLAHSNWIVRWNEMIKGRNAQNTLFDWLWTKAKHSKLGITCCARYHPSQMPIRISASWLRSTCYSLRARKRIIIINDARNGEKDSMFIWNVFCFYDWHPHVNRIWF